MRIAIIGALIAFVFFGAGFIVGRFGTDSAYPPTPGAPNGPAVFVPDPEGIPIPSVPTSSPGVHPQRTNLIFTFNVPGILEESEFDTSSSPYWWLDSGGRLVIAGGIGKTIQGALSEGDPWRRRYATSNSADTDNGYHPQNLIRLVSRITWKNPRVEAAFRIIRDNLSTSVNRNASNGLLLMTRYRDADTLYYAGIRVDGYAIIKKKYLNVYYTMAEKKVFPGAYDRNMSPNLLPKGEWLHLAAETMTAENGTVLVGLFMKRKEEQTWTALLSTADDGSFGETPPIPGPARFGIRTDFMDVEFDNVHVSEIP